MTYVYFWLDLCTLLFPLLLSFDKKIAFYKNWSALFPAIALMGVFFIVWDSLFTRQGVWGFNNDYLTGIYIFNLPLEEVLFFLFVPYACVFIYECLKGYFRTNPFQSIHTYLTLGLLTGLPLLAVIFHDRAYTFYTALFSWVLLLIQYIFLKKAYMSWFYTAYLIHLIPFAVINGVLTALPVVVYNNVENTGLRLYTIPVEDTLYSLLLFLGNVMIMEFLKEKKLKQKIQGGT